MFFRNKKIQELQNECDTLKKEYIFYKEKVATLESLLENEKTRYNSSLLSEEKAMQMIKKELLVSDFFGDHNLVSNQQIKEIFDKHND